MSQLQHLRFPIGLGILAGFLNWMNISSVISPHEYLVTTKNVQAGTPIEADAFATISLRHDQAQKMKDILFTSDDVNLIAGRRVVRNLQAGQLISRADVSTVLQDDLRPGEQMITIKFKKRSASSLFVGQKVELEVSQEARSQYPRVPTYRVLAIAPPKDDDDYWTADLAAQTGTSAITLKELQLRKNAIVDLYPLPSSRNQPSSATVVAR